MADPIDPINPSDGTTPVALPEHDECCQSPCDPPWRKGPSCTTFTETRRSLVPLQGDVPRDQVSRGAVQINVTYEHRLCLIGKQHGGLAYTLTLLPGETMTLFHSDRYRRTTSETERYSVQTTFSQFVSALYQSQNSSDSSALIDLLSNKSSSSSSGGGFSLFGLGGASSSDGNSANSSSKTQLSADQSSSQFMSLAHQASQYTDLQRSITVSSYEDTESASTTQRTVTNKNACHAVNYFVRKVLDTYALTTTVTAVTFQVRVGNYVSAVLTPEELDQVEPALQAAVKAALAGIPAIGAEAKHPTVLSVPTDGVVYDPELAHCCAQDPALEQAELIKLEREQAEAQLLGLKGQLAALEVQRRQLLLAAGTLTPFDPPPVEPVPA